MAGSAAPEGHGGTSRRFSARYGVHGTSEMGQVLVQGLGATRWNMRDPYHAQHSLEPRSLRSVEQAEIRRCLHQRRERSWISSRSIAAASAVPSVSSNLSAPVRRHPLIVDEKPAATDPMDRAGRCGTRCAPLPAPATSSKNSGTPVPPPVRQPLHVLFSHIDGRRSPPRSLRHRRSGRARCRWVGRERAASASRIGAHHQSRSPHRRPDFACVPMAAIAARRGARRFFLTTTPAIADDPCGEQPASSYVYSLGPPSGFDPQVGPTTTAPDRHDRQSQRSTGRPGRFERIRALDPTALVRTQHVDDTPRSVHPRSAFTTRCARPSARPTRPIPIGSRSVRSPEQSGDRRDGVSISGNRGRPRPPLADTDDACRSREIGAPRRQWSFGRCRRRSGVRSSLVEVAVLSTTTLAEMTESSRSRTRSTTDPAAGTTVDQLVDRLGGMAPRWSETVPSTPVDTARYADPYAMAIARIDAAASDRPPSPHVESAQRSTAGDDRDERIRTTRCRDCPLRLPGRRPPARYRRSSQGSPAAWPRPDSPRAP